MFITESIHRINELPFINDVEDAGGSILSVGGAVRDSFLGKESKDLDILITGIAIPNLTKILEKYGKVDLVGVSFGVLKFKPNGSTEDIDVVIPRTERKIGAGHKGFEVSSDPFLPLEDELGRRDFTLNAIAKDINGKVYDFFGGLNDIKNKIIRVINPQAFADDPLRMMRGVGFASRFGFTIEPETMALIQANASTIKTISPERILLELEKIVYKGDVEVGARILVETGLYPYIFNQPTIHDFSEFKRVKTLGEFIFLCLNKDKNASEFFKNNLKGDINTTKEIQALSILNLTNFLSVTTQIKEYIFRAINISSIVLNTKIFTNLDRYLNEFIHKKYPQSYKDLEINGNDLLAMGYKGQEVGEVRKFVLYSILSDEVKNEHKAIMDFIIKSRMKKLGGNGK